MINVCSSALFAMGRSGWSAGILPLRDESDKEFRVEARAAAKLRSFAVPALQKMCLRRTATSARSHLGFGQDRTSVSAYAATLYPRCRLRRRWRTMPLKNSGSLLPCARRITEALK
jgi:hypothetical protein